MRFEIGFWEIIIAGVLCRCMLVEWMCTVSVRGVEEYLKCYVCRCSVISLINTKIGNKFRWKFLIYLKKLLLKRQSNRWPIQRYHCCQDTRNETQAVYRISEPHRFARAIILVTNNIIITDSNWMIFLDNWRGITNYLIPRTTSLRLLDQEIWRNKVDLAFHLNLSVPLDLDPKLDAISLITFKAVNTHHGWR